jgi:hypothetical protein
VGFHDERYEVGVWVSPAFVVFSSLCCVVCVWGGVGGGCVFCHSVSDTDVDVVCGGVVPRGYVKDCTLLFGGARVEVEVGDVLFFLSVVAVLLEPLSEYAGDVVVFDAPLVCKCASGCVLSIGVEGLQALCCCVGSLAVGLSFV